MKYLIFCLLFSSLTYADCDLQPLREEIITQYKTSLPVTNEKGEIGIAKAKKFVVSNYLMQVEDENLLIANFELDIKWMKGTKQTVKTLVVATVDTNTCSIQNIDDGNALKRTASSK